MKKMSYCLALSTFAFVMEVSMATMAWAQKGDLPKGAREKAAHGDSSGKTAYGYGYGEKVTDKDQSRLAPDRDYNGPVTDYRTIPTYEQYEGTAFFYVARVVDAILRNGSVPEYYGKFAIKYFDRFNNEVYPTLTQEGQRFIKSVGVDLQRIIAQAISTNPALFARYERNPAAFDRFVVWSHVEAYTRNGFFSLPLSDQRKILGAIDIKDHLWAAKTYLSHPPGAPRVNPIPPEAGGQPSRQIQGVPGKTTDGRRYRF